MHIRRLPVVFFLALTVLLAGFAAGCGGGGESGSGQQGDADKSESKKEGQDDKKQPETKIALGTVGSVKPDAKRIVLRPSSEDKDAKPMKFKLRPKGRVIAEGKEVKLDEVESGQQAKIKYASGKKINGALSVEIVDGGGSGSDETSEPGGETTG